MDDEIEKLLTYLDKLLSWKEILLISCFENIILVFYICETNVWLISILMITKQGLELMIIFQVWLGKKISKVAITKKKSSQREINKKKKTSQKSVFQDLIFKGFLCKVFDVLGLSCITLLIYAPKSFKINFVLNPF